MKETMEKKTEKEAEERNVPPARTQRTVFHWMPAWSTWEKKICSQIQGNERCIAWIHKYCFNFPPKTSFHRSWRYKMADKDTRYEKGAFKEQIFFFFLEGSRDWLIDIKSTFFSAVWNWTYEFILEMLLNMNFCGFTGLLWVLKYQQYPFQGVSRFKSYILNFTGWLTPLFTDCAVHANNK